MRFITAITGVLAGGLLAATASGEYFSLIVIDPWSEMHHQPVIAHNTRLYAGRSMQTSSSCPLSAADVANIINSDNNRTPTTNNVATTHCPPGNGSITNFRAEFDPKVYYRPKHTEVDLWMGSTVPGGQQVWVSHRTGALRYARPHGASSIPKNAWLRGWNYANKWPLDGSGVGGKIWRENHFWACPARRDRAGLRDGPWQLFVNLDGDGRMKGDAPIFLPRFPNKRKCENVTLATVAMDGPAAYQYD